jgi:hypothetical protein
MLPCPAAQGGELLPEHLPVLVDACFGEPPRPNVTVIAEVPDPACAGACGSGFAQVYTEVRQKLLNYLNSAQSEARPLVRITGVGVFDYLHGQRGVAPNGIELHPVLDVAFP